MIPRALITEGIVHTTAAGAASSTGPQLEQRALRVWRLEEVWFQTLAYM